MMAAAIDLVPAAARDRFMLRGWLIGPGSETWTGTRASMEAALAMALDQPSAMARIARNGNIPIGYLHALDLPPSHRAARTNPAGMLWLDVLTPERIDGRSELMSAMVEAFVTEVFETTLVPALGVLVPVRQERVVRCLERAGFVWANIDRHDTLGPTWLLLRERGRRVA